MKKFICLMLAALLPTHGLAVTLPKTTFTGDRPSLDGRPSRDGFTPKSNLFGKLPTDLTVYDFKEALKSDALLKKTCAEDKTPSPAVSLGAVAKERQDFYDANRAAMSKEAKHPLLQDLGFNKVEPPIYKKATTNACAPDAVDNTPCLRLLESSMLEPSQVMYGVTNSVEDLEYDIYLYKKDVNLRWPHPVSGDEIEADDEVDSDAMIFDGRSDTDIRELLSLNSQGKLQKEKMSGWQGVADANQKEIDKRVALTKELVAKIDQALALGQMEQYAAHLAILKKVNPSAAAAIECLGQKSHGFKDYSAGPMKKVGPISGIVYSEMGGDKIVFGGMEIVTLVAVAATLIGVLVVHYDAVQAQKQVQKQAADALAQQDRHDAAETARATAAQEAETQRADKANKTAIYLDCKKTSTNCENPYPPEEKKADEPEPATKPVETRDQDPFARIQGKSADEDKPPTSGGATYAPPSYDDKGSVGTDKRIANILEQSRIRLVEPWQANEAATKVDADCSAGLIRDQATTTHTQDWENEQTFKAIKERVIRFDKDGLTPKRSAEDVVKCGQQAFEGDYQNAL